MTFTVHQWAWFGDKPRKHTYTQLFLRHHNYNLPNYTKKLKQTLLHHIWYYFQRTLCLIKGLIYSFVRWPKDTTIFQNYIN
jgi:hypothetical protein